MQAVFVDASPVLAAVAVRLRKPGDPPLRINQQPDVTSAQLPAVLDAATVAIIDHTHLPTAIARQCRALKHVVFLGTGARSYMNPEELAELGITVHIIKGYGDTAVAECAFGLMWAAAKGFARMDRGMRAGPMGAQRRHVQLTGKTLGLDRLRRHRGGTRPPRDRQPGCSVDGLEPERRRRHPGVTFVSLETLLAESDVVSLHLLLTDETRGFLSAKRLGALRPGAILINTARGALVDEAALTAALASGRLLHAGLDVYDTEPLPADHPLTRVDNATLSAHSAFRTPEASDNLIEAALQHCRAIAASRP